MSDYWSMKLDRHFCTANNFAKVCEIDGKLKTPGELVKSRMLLLSVEPHWWNHKGGLWRRTDTGADILVNSTFLECK